MLNQIKTFGRLELVNLFGLNVLRHTKDKNEKKKKIFLAAVIGIAILMAALYVGGYAYGLIWLGMPDLVPVYLTVLASMIILFFGFFKAGGEIFRQNDYDIVSSLPVPQTVIVFCRFLRMYVEDLALTCVVMLPGMLVCGVFEKRGISFYLFGILGILFIPMIPLAIAVFVGALITRVVSGMRHKSLVEAGLTIAVVVVVMALSAGMGGVADELDPEKLRELADMLAALLGKVYPPSLWIGEAMTGAAVLKGLLFVGVSVLFAALSIGIASYGFHAICRRLFSHSAKHNYQMRAMGQDALLVSMCRRELKRYLSSGIYVSNTIIGPIMGLAVSIALFVAGADAIAAKIPFPLDLAGAAPFLIAAVFCMMNLSCVSISIEGKNWWIVKSLPLDTRSILDAKILAALAVPLPFCLVAQVFLFLALKPGFVDALLLILAPWLAIAFSAVFGIAVNLRLPLMQWDSEVSVVKQSASAAVGGLGGALIPLVCALATAAAPREYSAALRLILCVLLAGLTIFLYQNNNRKDLREI